MPSGADLKSLFDHVQLLLEQARLRGETAQRAVAAAIDGMNEAFRAAGVQPGASPQPDELGKLDDKIRESLKTKLEGLAHGIETALKEEGPRNPDSVMYNEYASNGWVIALVVLGIVGSIGTISSIYCLWPRATAGLGQEAAVAERVVTELRKEGVIGPKSGTVAATAGTQTSPAGTPAAGRTEAETAGANSATAGPSTLATPSPAAPRAAPGAFQQKAGAGPDEGTVLLTIILLGALGGFLHWTSSLAQFIGNRELKRSWIAYYILMPVEGAALAPIVYMLLRVGVLSPGAGIAQVNYLALYAFAALTGLFSKQALSMLGDVFAVIFKRIQAKDAGATGTKP